MLNSNHRKGKILGIDYGSVRIGISISDETQTIAFGKTVLSNQSSALNLLLEIINKENICEIVLGYPLNLKGEKTSQTLAVEEFQEKLTNLLKNNNIAVNILRWDERLTSKMAENSLLVSGMKKKKRRDKSNLDIISAALILQSYLDSK